LPASTPQLKAVKVSTSAKRASYERVEDEPDANTVCLHFLQSVPNGKLSGEMLKKISSVVKRLGVQQLGQLVNTRKELRDEIMSHMVCCIDRTAGRLGARVNVRAGGGEREVPL